MLQPEARRANEACRGQERGETRRHAREERLADDLDLSVAAPGREGIAQDHVLCLIVSDDQVTVQPQRVETGETRNERCPASLGTHRARLPEVVEALYTRPRHKTVERGDPRE